MATVAYTHGFYGLSKDFPYLSITGPFSSLDSVAQNDIGTRYAQVLSQNSPSQEQTVLRYVQYVSTANPAPLAYPAPVYWVDSTFSKVSGVFSEGLGANFLAGWLLPNTTAIPSLTSSLLANAFVWIADGGFLAGAAVTGAPAVGASIFGAAGNWTTAFLAAGTAPTNRVAAWAVTAESGGICDLMITAGYTI